MSDNAPASKRVHIARRFSQHVLSMPGWHKKVLLLAIVLAGAGIFGQAAGYLSNKSNTALPTADKPKGSRAFDSGIESSQRAADVEPSWWQKVSPTATRIGVSVIVGFIIGWIFRAFLKTMVLITLVVVGVLFALSYFNVLNLDLTAARQQYDTAAQWLSDQASKLKDLAVDRIPSGLSGFFGMFLGMRRR